MSMMKEADELRDRYECVFVKWGVRDDSTSFCHTYDRFEEGNI